MKDAQDSLDIFIKDIIEDATEESQSILARIQETHDQKISAAEDSFLEECYKKIKNEIAVIRADNSRIISQKSMEYKRALYLRREEMIGRLFDDLIVRLREYCATDAYRTRMEDLCRKAADKLGGDSCRIYLRAQDLPLSDSFALLFHGNAKFAAGDFTLGGLKAESADRKIHIDETFDTALTQLRSEFGVMFHLNA